MLSFIEFTDLCNVNLSQLIYSHISWGGERPNLVQHDYILTLFVLFLGLGPTGSATHTQHTNTQ